MERPQTLSGAHIEAADVTLHVGLAGRHAAGFVRRSHNDHVVRNDRRGVKTDFGTHRIDHLVVVILQIYDAILAEGRH
jgi:hypothetical protein